MCTYGGICPFYYKYFSLLFVFNVVTDRHSLLLCLDIDLNIDNRYRAGSHSAGVGSLIGEEARRVPAHRALPVAVPPGDASSAPRPP